MATIKRNYELQEKSRSFNEFPLIWLNNFAEIQIVSSTISSFVTHFTAAWILQPPATPLVVLHSFTPLPAYVYVYICIQYIYRVSQEERT